MGAGDAVSKWKMYYKNVFGPEICKGKRTQKYDKDNIEWWWH